LTDDCKDFISKLLEKDVKKRLGHGNTECQDLKNHSWFKDIDFEKLYNKEIDAPYKPKVSEDNLFDLANFEPEFTKEAAKFTIIGKLASKLISKNEHKFQNE
jgi:serine/threonine protein kinase